MTGCEDDSPSVAIDPPSGGPAATATTAPAASAVPSVVPVPAVTAPPRPSASPSPAPGAGRVDGTVAPQNPGATDPVTVKANPDPFRGTALLRDVRLGVHPEEGGWERIVFEFERELPPGRIEYVPSAAGCGSGLPVSLRGTAILLVRFDQAAAHTDAGQPTLARTALTGAGDTILEARQTCDFEAQVEWAFGVKGRQRFKVTQLENPRRLVIDVKQ